MAAIINKNYTNESDVKSVGRKQNCALSEKGAWIECEIIKDAGNKQNKRNKPEAYPGLAQNSTQNLTPSSFVVIAV